MPPVKVTSSIQSTALYSCKMSSGCGVNLVLGLQILRINSARCLLISTSYFKNREL